MNKWVDMLLMQNFTELKNCVILIKMTSLFVTVFYEGIPDVPVKKMGTFDQFNNELNWCISTKYITHLVHPAPENDEDRRRRFHPFFCLPYNGEKYVFLFYPYIPDEITEEFTEVLDKFRICSHNSFVITNDNLPIILSNSYPSDFDVVNSCMIDEEGNILEGDDVRGIIQTAVIHSNGRNSLERCEYRF